MVKPSRIVAIDFGTRRIGLAVSDPTKLIATPLETLTAEKKGEKTAAKVLAYLEGYCLKMGCQVECIVVGMPLLMSGKRGFLADEVHHFIELLKNLTQIPIVMWDERLTTVQAERTLRESSLSRKKRAKVVDSIAAIIILQSYLDAKR